MYVDARSCWRLLSVSALTAATAGCGLLTGDYTLEGGGGSDSCARVFFDDFDEPLAVNWNADGMPLQDDGVVTFDGNLGTSGIDTQDLVDLSAGGCLTVKFNTLSLIHEDDRMTVRLSNAGIDLQIAMEASGDVIAAFASNGSGSDVLSGLRQGDVLRTYWRLCLDSTGQGSFFVSTDGVTYDDVSPTQPLFAPFETDKSSVSLSLLATANSSVGIDWVELCAEMP